MKRWKIRKKFQSASRRIKFKIKDIIELILENRDINTKKKIDLFLHPQDPFDLTANDVGIDKSQLHKSLKRIQKAIDKKESIVVYADYDADGVCAGAIMWERLHELGAKVMPYIPHRVEEGYGLSIKGIEAVKEQFNPLLIITVDHGITAAAKVEYAQSLGIDVVITDHHVVPAKLPDCPIVHTTKLCGVGIAWFMAKELSNKNKDSPADNQLLELAAIGTIADLVPLVGPNRSIVKYGLDAMKHTRRVGLEALITDAGLNKSVISVYDVSHVIAPRLNAMGRLEHALDSLRLLCTKRKDKSILLAQKLGLTNRERQQLTGDTALHAIASLSNEVNKKKILFVSDPTYNPGVIGLVASRLVEQYYKPAIVVSRGEIYSKASARSVAGFNIIEAIRQCSDILVDVGGHPMAAGFTVETVNLAAVQTRLEALSEALLTEETLTRSLKIDAEIPYKLITEELVSAMDDFAPYGFGNPEPVFSSQNVKILESRLVGSDGKHLKLRLTNDALGSTVLDAIAFGMGNLSREASKGKYVSIAYTIGLDNWNGNRRLQLKIKDIHFE